MSLSPWLVSFGAICGLLTLRAFQFRYGVEPDVTLSTTDGIISIIPSLLGIWILMSLLPDVGLLLAFTAGFVMSFGGLLLMGETIVRFYEVPA